MDAFYTIGNPLVQVYFYRNPKILYLNIGGYKYAVESCDGLRM